MDEPHSYDFLIYAYLQSGQDIKAKKELEASNGLLDAVGGMGGHGGHRSDMVPYYRLKLPGFYALEMHDWKTASAMEPVAGTMPATATLAYWVRAQGGRALEGAGEGACGSGEV